MCWGAGRWLETCRRMLGVSRLRLRMHRRQVHRTVQFCLRMGLDGGARMVRASSAAMLALLLLTVVGCGEKGRTPSATSQPTPVAGLQVTPTPGQETITGASSGVLEEMSLLQLVSAADLIMTGSVEEINSQWNSGQDQINTDVGVSVQQCVKGPWQPSRVTIRVSGGQVGDIVQSSSVGPQFEVGEEVLVFLEFGEEGTARVVGGFQGKLTFSEHKVVGSDVSLDSFLSQVRQIMRDARISEGACEGD